MDRWCDLRCKGWKDKQKSIPAVKRSVQPSEDRVKGFPWKTGADKFDQKMLRVSKRRIKWWGEKRGQRESGRNGGVRQ